MTIRNKATLKGFYNTGDTPTEAQYADLIDSCYNIVDDADDVEKVNYVTPSVGGGVLTIDFAGKAAAYADSVGGGGISLNRGDTVALNLINITNAEKCSIVVNVGGGADNPAFLNLPVNTSSNASCYDYVNNRFMLDTGVHIIKFTLTGAFNVADIVGDNGFLIITSTDVSSTTPVQMSNLIPPGYNPVRVAVKIKNSNSDGAIFRWASSSKSVEPPGTLPDRWFFVDILGDQFPVSVLDTPEAITVETRDGVGLYDCWARCEKIFK